MKTNIFLITIAFAISSLLNAQNINTEITENTNSPYLLGKIDKSGLEGDNYKSWFSKNYNDYQPNTEITTEITPKLKSYEIILFMGTWCGDSKQEVPKLYKVLETCNFSMNQLTVIAVSKAQNMYKQSPKHEEKGLNIHRVPTVIFYRDGIEVNRIVEHPIKSFEEDIMNIVTVNDYESNYQIVTAINTILDKKGVKALKRNRKKLLKKFKNQVTNMYELNTYGRVLYGTNRIEEAIEVFKLNTALFPDEPRTYMSLANTLSLSGYKEKAIKIIEDALKKHPKNANLIENLNNIKSQK